MIPLIRTDRGSVVIKTILYKVRCFQFENRRKNSNTQNEKTRRINYFLLKISTAFKNTDEYFDVCRRNIVFPKKHSIAENSIKEV